MGVNQIKPYTQHTLRIVKAMKTAVLALFVLLQIIAVQEAIGTSNFVNHGGVAKRTTKSFRTESVKECIKCVKVLKTLRKTARVLGVAPKPKFSVKRWWNERICITRNKAAKTLKICEKKKENLQKKLTNSKWGANTETVTQLVNSGETRRNSNKGSKQKPDVTTAESPTSVPEGDVTTAVDDGTYPTTLGDELDRTTNEPEQTESTVTMHV